MSAVATREHSKARLFEPPRSEDEGLTLEDSILAVWEDLAVSDRAECPVCGGPIGRESPCDDCGSELS